MRRPAAGCRGPCTAARSLPRGGHARAGAGRGAGEGDLLAGGGGEGADGAVGERGASAGRGEGAGAWVEQEAGDGAGLGDARYQLALLDLTAEDLGGERGPGALFEEGDARAGGGAV